MMRRAGSSKNLTPLLERLLRGTGPPRLPTLIVGVGVGAVLALIAAGLSGIAARWLSRIAVILMVLTTFTAPLTAFVVTRPEIESEQFRLLRLTFVDKAMVVRAFVLHALYRIRVPLALTLMLVPTLLIHGLVRGISPAMSELARAVTLLMLVLPAAPLGVVMGVSEALRHRDIGYALLGPVILASLLAGIAIGVLFIALLTGGGLTLLSILLGTAIGVEAGTMVAVDVLDWVARAGGLMLLGVVPIVHAVVYRHITRSLIAALDEEETDFA